MKKWGFPVLISLVVLLGVSFSLWGQRREEYAGWGALRFLNKLEQAWYDFKFKARAPEKAPGVVVARIDDLSLQRFGRWPWTRAIYQEILNLLFERGASVVAFDAVFSEPEFRKQYVAQYLSVAPPGKDKSLRELIPLKDEQVESISELLPLVGDQIFANAVSQNPRTVLGYIWEGADACGKDSFEVDLANLSRHAIFTEQLPALDATSVKNFKVPTYICPVSNRAVIQKDARFQGFFNSFPDEDGIFRRAQLLLSFYPPAVPAESREWLEPKLFSQLSFFPSLSLAALAAHWDSPAMEVDVQKDAVGKVLVHKLRLQRKNLPTLEIPLLGDASFKLNFFGSQHTKPFAPIAEISLGNIEGDLNRDAFQKFYGLNPLKPLENQIVLIGPTALGVYDLRPNSVQEDALGVYLHATTVGRILEWAQNPHSLLRIEDISFQKSLLLIWVLGLLLAAVIVSTRAVWGAVATFTGIALFLAVDFFIFTEHGVALNAVAQVNTFAAIFISVFAYKYFTEERDRAFVKQAFEKYVSPDVVGDILKNPKKLNLGGQKKNLSVLFSDIRSFTTISEKMEASQLSKFLNEYLSPMTDVVQENRGTIDKYMGDAIMAIFGAPVEDPDHATHAVSAGLRMLRRLDELRGQWKAQNLPDIDIGVGVNTGDMSVGNMGSTRIFSYTVMGDSVNLGSRLEGLTKEYGVRFIVSEFTRAQLKDDFVVRELDQVKVKGKKEAVRIFEVRSFKSDNKNEDWVPHFETALRNYYAGRFAEALEQFKALTEKDATSKIYQRRCELLLKTHAGMGWDGTWTMTTK